MRISSHEVEAVKFPVTVRGYAEDEVDSFLDVVFTTIGEYEQHDTKARNEIDQLRSDLDECREARLREIGTSGSLADRYGEVEARLNNMLEAAVRTSERIVEEALEAGAHILDQIRTALTAPLPRAEPDGPENPAEVEQDGGSHLTSDPGDQ